MTQLGIAAAAARLEELVAAAAAGEDVVIADTAGRPVARLVAEPERVPSIDEPTVRRPPGWTDAEFSDARARGYGMFVGQIHMSDDCFDPMAEDELKEWGLL